MHSITALVTRPCEPSILLLPGSGGWALPRLSLDSDRVLEINAAVAERLGLTVTALRYLSHGWVGVKWESDEEWAYLFEVQAEGNAQRDGDTPPGDGRRWVRRDELGSLGLPRDDRAYLEEAFAGMAGETPLPPRRNPWTQPGWFGDAVAWIDERLAANGLARTGPVLQRRSWSISCLLAAPTDAGEVFFKAVPLFFKEEHTIASGFAAQYPEHSLKILAHDDERGWILTRKANGDTLSHHEKENPEVPEEALRRFARIQMDWIDRKAELLAWGCADRGVETLPGEIDRLWDELQSREKRDLYDVTDADWEALMLLADRLKALAGELADCGIPETLIHGDLHGGNIMVEDGRPLFIDWSDAAVSHPFFDLETMLPNEDEEPEQYRRERDAYLEPWTERFDRDRLLRALFLSRRVGPAYHAASYRILTGHLEPMVKWEMADGVWEFLKRVLKVKA